jgi:hypothetical protein
MSTQRISGLFALVLAMAYAAWTGGATADGPKAWAESYDPFFDGDGDQLPDALEWVTMTDPLRSDTDGNSVDDFLEVVQHRLPLDPWRQKPVDHEMRVLLFGTTDPFGRADIWLTMMFRFASNGLSRLQSLQPFVDLRGLRMPLDQVFSSTPMVLNAKVTANEGTYVFYCARLCARSELESILPATIGVTAFVDGRRLVSGSYILSVDSTPTALLPVGAGRFAFQPIDMSDAFNNQFWKQNKVCVLALDVLGTSGGGHLCEVRSAECAVANRLVCATNCTTCVGLLIFVPDGLTIITGS